MKTILKWETFRFGRFYVNKQMNIFVDADWWLTGQCPEFLRINQLFDLALILDQTGIVLWSPIILISLSSFLPISFYRDTIFLHSFYSPISPAQWPLSRVLLIFFVAVQNYCKNPFKILHCWIFHSDLLAVFLWFLCVWELFCVCAHIVWSILQAVILI